MSAQKSHVNRGDTVEVIAGNHRGAQGKVLQVLRTKDQVIVEGVRMVKRHVKKSQDHPNGEIVEREGPLAISNVKRLEKGVTDQRKGA